MKYQLFQPLYYSGDDHYSEWMPHASWNPNGPAWQTLNLEHGPRPSPAVGPRPDPDPHLEQFTKEPEGTACLRWGPLQKCEIESYHCCIREVSRTPSPSPSTIRRPTGRRLPPTPRSNQVLYILPYSLPYQSEHLSNAIRTRIRHVHYIVVTGLSHLQLFHCTHWNLCLT